MRYVDGSDGLWGGAQSPCSQSTANSSPHSFHQYDRCENIFGGNLDKIQKSSYFFFAKPSLNSPIERTDKYSFVSGLPKPYEYLWPSNFWHRYWSTGWKWVGTRLRDLIEALGGVRPHRQEKVGGLFGIKIILGYRNICFTGVPYASRFHSQLSV